MTTQPRANFVQVHPLPKQPPSVTTTNTGGQPTLWSYAESVRARDKGIALAEYGATQAWRADALNAVHACAQVYAEFTADDVWLILKRRTGEPRALGSVMQSARRKGWIAPTDRFTPTHKTSQHAQPIRVWKSLVHQG